jgi:hypothetical protein
MANSSAKSSSDMVDLRAQSADWPEAYPIAALERIRLNTQPAAIRWRRTKSCCVTQSTPRFAEFEANLRRERQLEAIAKAEPAGNSCTSS